jgi:hypothetical protein
MMRTLGMASLLLFALAPAALAQAPAPKIDFLEVEGSGFADPTDVVAPGKIMRYFSRTPAAAAHPGTAFGMTVKTVGQPQGAEIVLRWVWKLPKPGIKDAKTGKPTRQIVEEVPTKIGVVVQHNFEFRDKEQIVPGKWRAEVYNGERRLAVRRFAIK